MRKVCAAYPHAAPVAPEATIVTPPALAPLGPVSMPFADYLALPAEHKSGLVPMLRSPAHYLAAKSAPHVESAAFAIGSATHTAILEPDRYLLDCTSYTESKTKGEGARTRWEAFKAANAKKVILDEDDHRACCAMRDAVRRHSVAASYLATGAAEQVIVATDPVTGLRVKIRIDWLTGGAIVDLKTTTDADGEKFGRDAAKYLYHMQGALYSDVFAWAFGESARLPFKFLVVEKSPPFDVAVFSFGEDDLEAGRDTYRRVLDRVAACRDAGAWPGRYPNETPLLLPPWVWPDGETADLDLQFNESEES